LVDKTKPTHINPNCPAVITATQFLPVNLLLNPKIFPSFSFANRHSSPARCTAVITATQFQPYMEESFFFLKSRSLATKSLAAAPCPARWCALARAHSKKKQNEPTAAILAVWTSPRMVGAPNEQDNACRKERES